MTIGVANKVLKVVVNRKAKSQKKVLQARSTREEIIRIGFAVIFR